MRNVRILPSEIQGGTDLTCSSCGRPCSDLAHHVDEWRDAGHRPQITRELNPLTEVRARSIMRRAPRR
jgi:hypothetical protein